MKSNPDKCHLLFGTNENVAIRIGNFQIENTKREKLRYAVRKQAVFRLSFIRNMQKM